MTDDRLVAESGAWQTSAESVQQVLGEAMATSGYAHAVRTARAASRGSLASAVTTATTNRAIAAGAPSGRVADASIALWTPRVTTPPNTTFEQTLASIDLTASFRDSITSTLRAITSVSDQIRAAEPVLLGALRTVHSVTVANHQMVHEAARTLGAVRPVLPYIDASLAQASRAAASVVRLIKHWDVLSGLGNLHAGTALSAARAARTAIVEYGPDGAKDAVDFFARAVLGLRSVTHWVREAVVAALLDPQWETLEGDDDDEHRADFKWLYHRHRQATRLIGETTLMHRRVDSLDRSLLRSNPGGPTLLSVQRARSIYLDPVEDAITDPRLIAVLNRLDGNQKAVAVERAQTGATWAAAAESVGLTREYGERLGRRVRDLRKSAAQTA